MERTAVGEFVLAGEVGSVCELEKILGTMTQMIDKEQAKRVVENVEVAHRMLEI